MGAARLRRGPRAGASHPMSETAVRLLVAIDAGVSPDEVEVEISWADTATRSVAQAADAAVKLAGENIINSEQASEMVDAGKDI